jgi:hypothetical protein
MSRRYIRQSYRLDCADYCAHKSRDADGSARRWACYIHPSFTILVCAYNGLSVARFIFSDVQAVPVMLVCIARPHRIAPEVQLSVFHSALLGQFARLGVLEIAANDASATNLKASEELRRLRRLDPRLHVREAENSDASESRHENGSGVHTSLTRKSFQPIIRRLWPPHESSTCRRNAHKRETEIAIPSALDYDEHIHSRRRTAIHCPVRWENANVCYKRVASTSELPALPTFSSI